MLPGVAARAEAEHKRQLEGQLASGGGPGAGGNPDALKRTEQKDRSVNGKIVVARAGVLNALTGTTLADALMPAAGPAGSAKARLAKRLESDADAQLLITLPFDAPQMLTGIELTLAVGDVAAQRAVPKTIAIFKNNPNLDFTGAESTLLRSLPRYILPPL